MKRIKYILLSVVALLAAATLTSCITDKGEPDNSAMVYMTLNPSIAIEYPDGTGTGDEAATRAPIEGQFYAGSGWYYYLGFTVTNYPGAAGSPDNLYMPEYNNIYTRYFKESYSAPLEMRYTIGDKEVVNKLPLYRNGGKVQLCGYYPHIATVDDITAIPFDVEERSSTSVSATTLARDYMWIEPVVIDPSNASSLSVDAKLRHAMTLLKFTPSSLGSGGLSSVYISKVVVETADGGQWLPCKGFFDATTGLFDVREYKNEINIYPLAHLGQSGYSNIYLMMPEIAVNKDQSNAKLKFTFYFNYINISSHEPELMISDPAYLDLGQIHDNKGNYGLRTSYRYTVYLRFDNITKITFDNIPAAEAWDTVYVDIEV